MNLQLKSKVAIVTGASRGIGKAISKKLASEGSNIALVARSEKDLENVKSEIQSESNEIKCEYFICDTRFDDQVKKMITDVFSLFGSVDILVNCAAMPASGTSRIDSFEGEDLMEQIDVKVSGYLRCAKYASKYMKDNGWGRIINISAGSADVRNHSVYSLANSGVRFITECLALELGPEVATNAISPGQIKESAPDISEFDPTFVENTIRHTPMGRLVTRQEIARVAVLLCSQVFNSVTGQTIRMDGGKAFPGNQLTLERRY